MLAILIICLVIFGAISLPIGIAMGLATMLCLVFATNIDPIMVAQNAFAGIDSFSLMAIPFFMLAGNFMRYGGISKRLLDLADNIVGFFTGGLGAITTFTAMFYAAISGSGPATVSAIGSFMIPEMEEKGYDKGYATALSAAAGTIGVIIPPSIPFVIYGVATGTSIGDMFKAGVIPGLLMGLALMLYNWATSKKYGWKGNGRRFNFKALGKSFIDSFWAILSPVIILGGIYGGFFTPTEAAAVSCVYTFIIGTFVYKEIHWKEFVDCMKDTVVIAGATSFIVGMSTSFAYVMTLEQVPETLSAFILGISDNKIIILLLMNVFLLVVGMFMDNISSCTILAPILLPVAVALGVNPVHFGIVMTMNLAIGFHHPALRRQPVRGLLRGPHPVRADRQVDLAVHWRHYCGAAADHLYPAAVPAAGVSALTPYPHGLRPAEDNMFRIGKQAAAMTAACFALRALCAGSFTAPQGPSSAQKKNTVPQTRCSSFVVSPTWKRKVGKNAVYLVCSRFSLSQLEISRLRYCRRRRGSSSSASLPIATIRFTAAISAAGMLTSLSVPQVAQ